MKLKLNTKSVRFKIWIYMMLFSLAILLMLWLMQIVFIQVFYQSLKTSDITQEAGNIATLYSQIQGTALETRLDNIANNVDLSVNITDTEGNQLYQKNPIGRDYNKPVESMGMPPAIPGGDINNPNNVNSQGNTANPGNNNNNNNASQPQATSPFAEFRKKTLAQASGELMQSIDDSRGGRMLLYGKILYSSSNEKAVLVISSPIQPLTETLRILSQQLVFISLVIFALALVLSYIIAMTISKPLMRITAKAKLLAKGKYDMTFDGGSYAEVNQLADTLNYATKALMQVENLRTELIANVSHDLRTPLTMIKIYAEMIRDLNGENRKKREQNVAVIIEESDRLTSLVQNLLDLSKMQSGAMPFQPAVFDLTQMIKRILPRYDALVQREGYHFLFSHNEPLLVNGDECRVEQVLYNLLNNAVNYTGADKTISLGIAQTGSTVRVSVTDTGEGIAPENIDLIWDRYYKVDKQHKRAVAGNGLGLSIVRSILDLHGTHYGVSSVPGQGATFWFELNKA